MPVWAWRQALPCPLSLPFPLLLLLCLSLSLSVFRAFLNINLGQKPLFDNQKDRIWIGVHIQNNLHIPPLFFTMDQIGSKSCTYFCLFKRSSCLQSGDVRFHYLGWKGTTNVAGMEVEEHRAADRIGGVTGEHSHLPFAAASLVALVGLVSLVGPLPSAAAPSVPGALRISFDVMDDMPVTAQPAQPDEGADGWAEDATSFSEGSKNWEKFQIFKSVDLNWSCHFSHLGVTFNQICCVLKKPFKATFNVRENATKSLSSGYLSLPALWGRQTQSPA